MTKKQLSTDLTTSAISAFLSMLLIILIIFYGVFAALKSLAAPKSIRSAVAGIGSEVLAEDYPEIKKTFVMFEFNEKQANDFLRSDAAKDMFELYSKDIFNAMAGENTESVHFTAENVQGVMVSHLDELTKISLKSDKEQDALEVESRIFKTIKKGTPGFVKSFPTAKELSVRFENSGFSFLLKVLSINAIPKILIISIFILAASIYFLRSYKFWGILWLGNICMAGAVIFGILAMVSVVGVGEYLLSGFMVDFNFAMSFGWVLFIKLLGTFLILCLLAIILYITYSKLKKHFYGKKKA